MNFGSEFSTLDNLPKENSLYNTYYKPYLVNLFRSKTRIVKVKEKLPISLLGKINLEDAIIIRDKKYRINDLTSDLTTGVTNLVLISDFVAQSQRLAPYVTPDSGGTIVVPIKPTDGGTLKIELTSGTGFSTPSVTLPATGEGEQNFTLTVPANSTGADRQEVYTVTPVLSDGTTQTPLRIVVIQEGSSSALLKEDGGFLLQEDLSKILL